MHFMFTTVRDTLSDSCSLQRELKVQKHQRLAVTKLTTPKSVVEARKAQPPGPSPFFCTTQPSLEQSEEEEEEEDAYKMNSVLPSVCTHASHSTPHRFCRGGFHASALQVNELYSQESELSPGPGSVSSPSTWHPTVLQLTCLQHRKSSNSIISCFLGTFSWHQLSFPRISSIARN